MFNIKEYKAELEAICDFTEIYDQFRLVDPFTSDIYMFKDGAAVLTDELPCYKIWNRDVPCQNCISLRACRDNSQFVKLEYLGNSVLMIVAKPVVVNGKAFSLELAKDVSNSLIFRDELHHEQTEISELISKVNQMAITDIFTGLYNNAFIKNKIITLTQCNNERPFSILIVDIDHFKLVNDRYGHLAGDSVIKEIALELGKFSAIPGCYIGRMGGDEFCIVFESCKLPEAERLAADAIEKIRAHMYQGQGMSFNVDVSIGVGEYNPKEDAFAFIERVDRAMYDVKHSKGIM